MAEKNWTPEQIAKFTNLNDFHVAPFHPDMKTTGTPTFIWSVVVEGDLYIRAGYGQKSRWYAAAKAQKAGKIELGGQTYDVVYEFVPEKENEALMEKIDKAYYDKYGSSDLTSTKIMTEKTPDGPRTTTFRILPR